MTRTIESILAAALDAAAAPVGFFVRDDDGGWDDQRLFALIDVTAQAGVAIDVAMIPLATGAALAAALRRCARDIPGLLRLHQHGHAHVNHEPAGRKCEFGPARDAGQQRADLAAGQARLRELFGDGLDAIFTPPWNRCSPVTPGLLAALGYSALSRDIGCTHAQPAAPVPELAVHLDASKQWVRARELGAGAPLHLACEVARCIGQRAAGEPIGLMLHHATMGDEERSQLLQLLRALRAHPRATFRPMAQWIGAAGAVGGAEGCATRLAEGRGMRPAEARA